MSNERTQTILRLHCLNRLTKLQSKLEQPDWQIGFNRELELLVQIQTSLTLMLHDLGIECYVGEDWDQADRLDNPS
jgi:hypothetical protein